MRGALNAVAGSEFYSELIRDALEHICVNKQVCEDTGDIANSNNRGSFKVRKESITAPGLSHDSDTCHQLRPSR